MKICITSTGKNLEAQISPRFGRCPYFLVVDTENKEVKAIKNSSVQASRGAGVAAVQTVADADCKVLITGNVGPNAFYALEASGIEVFTGAFNMTGKEALRAYNDGDLDKADSATSRGGLGRGPAPSGAGRGSGGADGKGRGQAPSRAGRGGGRRRGRR